jgi:predicted amidohydrolase YtcJ
MRLSIFLLIISTAIGCQNAPEYDLAITNAIMFDGAAYHSESQTILIQGNQIKSIISNASYNKIKLPNAQEIDANDNFIMPGLIEGHGHLLNYGEGLSQLELGAYENWDKIIEAVEQKAAEMSPGTWIEGRGWHQEKWNKNPQDAVMGYPHQAEMSRRVPDHPVYLIHASGHAAFANQKAMELVGISIETSEPSGGRILRDASGQLAGVFEENSMDLISNYVKQTKDLNSIWEVALQQAGQSCLEHGITSFHDAGSSVDQINWFNEKAKLGEIPLRLYLMAYDSLHKLQQAFPDLRLINEGDSFLTCRAVKAYFDGALGSRGAWLLEAYADQPGYFGQNTMDVADLQDYADLCTEHKLQFCVHAIGDRANRETLNLFQKNTTSTQDHRWRVEHAQHIDPADQPRFSELGIIASMQPIHCTSDAPFVATRLGVDRAEQGAYVWRNLLDAGAHLAIGTDVPVESLNPFENMYAAVTRKRSPGENSFFTNQKMTRLEILKAFTSENAFAAFEESFKGKIAPGYVADLCLLNRDLMSCPDEDIHTTKVLFTMINGKIVFER